MRGAALLFGVLLAAAPAWGMEAQEDTAQLREALRRTTAELRATQEALARMQAERDALLRQAPPAAAPRQAPTRESPPEQRAHAAEENLQACRAKNARLVALGEEILHLYETRSFRSLLLQSYEPLLGLKRVELENLVQDYDDKLRDPAAAGPPGASKP